MTVSTPDPLSAALLSFEQGLGFTSPEHAEAFAEGQRIREQRGAEHATNLANTLFRDGLNDTLSSRAEVEVIKANFPETWKYAAGGLDPVNRHENGDLRHPQC